MFCPGPDTTRPHFHFVSNKPRFVPLLWWRGTITPSTNKPIIYPENEQKVTKGRAGIRWDSVVKKAWKDNRGKQAKVLSIQKVGGYKTEVKVRIEIRERPALIR